MKCGLSLRPKSKLGTGLQRIKQYYGVKNGVLPKIEVQKPKIKGDAYIIRRLYPLENSNGNLIFNYMTTENGNTTLNIYAEMEDTVNQKKKFKTMFSVTNIVRELLDTFGDKFKRQEHFSKKCNIDSNETKETILSGWFRDIDIFTNKKMKKNKTNDEIHLNDRFIVLD